MVNCPECATPGPSKKGFCILCGTKLNKSHKSPAERRMVVLTPLFFLLGTWSLSYELKIDLKYALTIAGITVSVYYSAIIFNAILAKLTKTDITHEMMWFTGIYAFLSLGASRIISHITIAIYTEQLFQYSPADYSSISQMLGIKIFFAILTPGIVCILIRNRKIGNEKVKRFVSFFPLAYLIIIAIVTTLFFIISEKNCLVKAKLYYEIGALEKARKTTDEIINLSDNSIHARYLKALILSNQMYQDNDITYAAHEMNKITSKAPDIAFYHYHASNIFMQAGLNNQAIKAAKKCIELLKEDSSMYIHTGNIFLLNNDRHSATKYFEKALELEPYNPVLLNNLAYTYLELNTNLKQALNMAKKSVELSPGRYYSLDTLAWAYFKNKKYDDALNTIQPVIDNYKQLPIEVEFHYAMILKKLNLLKNPVETFDKLLINPQIINNKLLFEKVYAVRKSLDESDNNDGD